MIVMALMLKQRRWSSFCEISSFMFIIGLFTTSKADPPYRYNCSFGLIKQGAHKFNILILLLKLRQMPLILPTTSTKKNHQVIE
jgi:hypothetical protein